MKKVIAVICCMVMAASCFLMAGCGGTDMSDSKYLGKWQATIAEYGGSKLGVDDALGGEFSFTLNADGTVDVVVTGDKESGKWSETDNGIKFEEGDEELNFVEEDGNLTLNYSGMKLTFEKE